MLKVTHISTWDNAGGAARAAFRLHEGLKRAEHESRMVVGWKVEPSSDIDAVMMGGTLGKRVVRRVASILDRDLGLQYLLLPWSGDFLRHPFIRSADIIHLHNLHGGYFPFLVLPKLCRIAPTIWTLHDMWGMTGKSAFSYDCERWKTGCGRCPILPEYPPSAVDATALLWRIKQRVYRRSDLTIVTPSRWLADLVRQSPLLGGFRVHRIPYGLDTSVFKPVPKPAARQCLGLPLEAQVVLFSSDGLTQRRKGAFYLRQALQQLTQGQGSNPLFLTMGGVSTVPELNGLRSPIHQAGMIRSEHLLAACYSAADVFVLATLADNLPNVIIESMACGTPVVSFNVGGVPEAVRHMETGYLAAYQDVADLAKGIQLLLNDPDLRSRMSRRCREIAEHEYSLDLQARRFVDLYHDVIDRHRSASVEQ